MAMTRHTALKAGSDEEQRSHGSSYEFVRAYEFVLPECTYSSTQICLNFDSGRIRTPLFLRKKMRKEKTKKKLGFQKKKVI